MAKIIWIIYILTWKTLRFILQQFIKPKPQANPLIVGFGGDYFYGNSKSVYLEYQKKVQQGEVILYWAVADRTKSRQWKKEGVNPLWKFSITKLPLFLKTNVWVGDHGPGDFPVKKHKKSFWVQVWHGIPFKGFAGNPLTKKYFNIYDLHPVSSQWLSDYYIEGIGVDPERVAVTGYPRIDRLINPFYDRAKIIEELDLNPSFKTILYAPTWAHESGTKKPLFPFSQDSEVIKQILSFLESNDLQMIIRLHPNYKIEDHEISDLIETSDRITLSSVRTDWDTEKLLAITDILITDWSSIANDFIVLDKPMIFLETLNELFEHGYALKPSARAGIIVDSQKGFFQALSSSLSNPAELAKLRSRIAQKIHFKMDGQASRRVIEEIDKRLTTFYEK